MCVAVCVWVVRTALRRTAILPDRPSAGLPKRAHLRVPAFKHHQNSTRRHPERHKKSETMAGNGEKNAKFWAPHPSGPHPSGPLVHVFLSRLSQCCFSCPVCHFLFCPECICLFCPDGRLLILSRFRFSCPVAFFLSQHRMDATAQEDPGVLDTMCLVSLGPTLEESVATRSCQWDQKEFWQLLTVRWKWVRAVQKRLRSRGSWVRLKSRHAPLRATHAAKHSDHQTD